ELTRLAVDVLAASVVAKCSCSCSCGGGGKMKCRRKADWKSLQGLLRRIRGFWAGLDIPRVWDTMEGLLRTIQQIGPAVLEPDLGLIGDISSLLDVAASGGDSLEAAINSVDLFTERITREQRKVETASSQ
ncbi:unnamed protein product, partial [Prorocentrum cordatum]